MIKIHKSSEGHRYTLEFTVNGKSHEWHHQYITGAEIRDLFEIPQEQDVFLAVKKPWKDEHVKDEDRIDLAREGVEHFYHKEKNPKYTIVVNGTVHHWNKHKISFEEVVILAFGKYDSNPNIRYTVNYSKGPHENPKGSMTKGDEVFVKDKMEFNVTETGRS
jgi:Multiubiquitin